MLQAALSLEVSKAKMEKCGWVLTCEITNKITVVKDDLSGRVLSGVIEDTGNEYDVRTSSVLRH